MKRIALALLVCAACPKKAAERVPTCAEVTDSMLKIMQSKYPGHGDMGAMGNREQAIKQCEAGNMTADEKRCIANAKTVDDLAQCRRASMQKAPGSAGSAAK